MAYTFFKGLSCYPDHSVSQTLHDCLEYGRNPVKTDGGRLVTAFNCDKNFSEIDFKVTQQMYELSTGRQVNRIIGTDKDGNPKQAPICYKLWQSFAPHETTPEEAHQIGIELAQKLFGEEYQYVVNTHIDQAHIHNHIYINAVNVKGTKKFNATKYHWKKIREISDALCKEHGLSIIIPGLGRRSKLYSKIGAFSYRDVIRQDVDGYLSQAKSYSELLTLLSEKYFVDTSGKYLKLMHKTNGQKKYFRVYSLGEEYAEEALKRHFVPTSKIVLSLTQEIKLRGQSQLNFCNNLSYADKMRNIKALAFTVGIINKNNLSMRSGLSERIKQLTADTDSLKNLISRTNQDIEKIILPAPEVDSAMPHTDMLMQKLTETELKLRELQFAKSIYTRLLNHKLLLTEPDEMKIIQTKERGNYNEPTIK